MKFWFFALFVPGVYAVTDSVWENSPEAETTRQVVVKSIFDDGSRVVVTVHHADAEDADSREIYPLCASKENEKEELQEAFDQGSPVSLEFEGRFSRCISQVWP